MNAESRWERGYKKLLEVDGHAGETVKNSLNEISPDLVRYIVEYAFGDIYCRDGLDLKSKEIAVVAALTAMGNAQPQLKVHLNGALNVGCTINEVKEIILQMSAYSGFPTCINAMNALRDVLQERSARGIADPVGDAPTNAAGPGNAATPDHSAGSDADRYARGAQALSLLDDQQVARLEQAYADFSPHLVKLILSNYADVYARDNLDKKYRQVATIAALTALGNAQPQLKFHIHAGLNVGLEAAQIIEIMLLMTVYAGFPAAINGTNVLKEVLQERNRER
ncbi:carboxymuconolactone decarboxylase [Heliobacterium undosum]|uniref:Carboxymuconolactone decarboxylase n=1 Tax=Heliomicrobium undosum TaxID=121734 RepID=A0A845L7H9_9FIRM|nr:carboxymuconolactone decarboxylase family protein [Heliomicrobium undosum]MZP30995.1 carboxymuconolactone decarboxylase [Heliomicrobium undosum]